MPFIPIDPDVLNEGHLAVGQLVVAVGAIDNELAAANNLLARFETGWFPSRDSDDIEKRISNRRKAWVQLNRKVTLNDRDHMSQIDEVACGIERVCGVRHDLAHGRVIFDKAEMGQIIRVWTTRPQSYMWPHYQGKEKTTFEMI